MNITLQKRRLQGLTFKGKNYAGLDLSSMSAAGATFEQCSFLDCELRLSDFQGARFLRCRFSGVDGDASIFRSVQLRHCDFVNSSFRHSAFHASVIEDTTFRRTKLQYTVWLDATVRSALFLDCNLHGADLRFIEANHVDWRGSNLWNVHVQLGCAFFNGAFDGRQADQFTGMVARVHPDQKKATLLHESAGKQYEVVARLMDDRDGEEPEEGVS